MWRVERPGPSPHAEALTAALAKALDTDGDGVISDGELKVAAAVLLAKFDADGDDCLTPLEIVPDLLTRPAGKRGAAPRVEVVDRLEGVPVWAFLVRIESLAAVAPIPPDRGVEVVGVVAEPVHRPGHAEGAVAARSRGGAETVRGGRARSRDGHGPPGAARLVRGLRRRTATGNCPSRELRNAKAVLTARGEQVVRAPDYSAPAVTVIVSAGTSGPPPVRLTKAPPPQRGPLWFRALDRNGDGDVSRKEFAGTDAQFKQYDADGDGLISADEADAGDKQLKPGGKP